MSCFIVSNNIINSIVCYMGRVSSIYDRRYLGNLLNKNDEETSIYIVNHNNYISEFGRDLINLNIKAFNYRYPNDKMEELKNYIHVPYVVSQIQLIKNIKCYLYQCDEGNFHEDLLYKFMDSLCYSLCYDFVSDSPNYDKLTWG